MKVLDILKDRAFHFKEKTAIIFQEQSISFEDLYQKTHRLATGFQSIGLGKGTKVAVFLPNWPEYIVSYLAVFSLGGMIIPLDFMLTEEEIIRFVNHSEATALIYHPKKGVDVAAVQKRCPSLQHIIFVRADISPATNSFFWEDLFEREDPFNAPDIQPEDYSSIFYTSGTTGHPKGVLLTYGHLDNPVESISYFLKPTSEDSYLCAGVPFSHIGGLDYILFMLYFGSTLVLMERFQPLEAIKNLEKYKITIFCVVPAMFIAILSLKENDKFDLSHLRYPVVFGAPSSPVILKRFHKLCPNATLLNGWGMTETAAPNTYSPPDISKIHSIGPFGVGMEARVVKDNGEECAPHEKGELWVRGKAVMVGYYKEEAMTRQVLTEDGWFKTGDIVVRDEEGLYYIVGRKKDMIKVGGEIVFASEIEDTLIRHPKVKEVAVIGIADTLRGEVPKAFVVPKGGETITAEEMRDFCKKRLAHFKIPHVFECVAQLPKNRTGKVDKKSLKQPQAAI